MKTPALLLAVAALCAGCAAPTPTVWVRAGQTDAELQRETYRCDYEAKVATPENPRAGLVESVDRALSVRAFKERCMRAHGWAIETRVPVVVK